MLIQSSAMNVLIV